MAVKLPVKTSLPSAPKPNARIAPLLYAGGMLVVGAALLIAKPRFGQVPEPRQSGDLHSNSRWRRAARTSRDTVQPFAPSNVTDSLGRSLLLGGAALVITRLLDEAS